MKKLISLYIIIIFVILSLMFTYNKGQCFTLRYPSNKTNILIVNSSDIFNYITRRQVNGFSSQFDDRYVLFSYYMNYDIASVSDLHAMYNNIKPSIVYAIGDTALLYFCMYKKIYKQSKIVYTSRYSPLDYDTTDKDRFTINGVVSYTNVRTLLDFLATIKYIPNNVLILYDNTYDSVLGAQYWKTNLSKYGLDVITKRIHFKNDLKYIKISKDTLIILIVNRLIDYKNVYMTPQTIVKTISKYFPKNIIVLQDSDIVKFGGTISVGYNSYQLGVKAAELAKQNNTHDIIIKEKDNININFKSFSEKKIELTKFDLGRFEIHVY